MYGYVGSVLADKGRQLYSIQPEATVRDAVRMMNDVGVGALVVLDGERIAGIFTERDVLRRVVDGGRHPGVTRVSAVMTIDVETIEPDMTVEDAMELMTARRFRHLPVVDRGTVVGMLSIGDVMRWVSMNQQEHIQRMSEYITGAGGGI